MANSKYLCYMIFNKSGIIVRVVPDIFKRNYRMALGNSYSYLESQNVLLDSKLNIRDGEVAHVPTAGRRLTCVMVYSPCDIKTSITEH